MFSSFHLQSDNENTVLGRLAFPADPRVASAFSSAFKLLHRNDLCIRFLSASSLTHTNERPRGGGNGRVGRTEQNPMDASAGGLGCRPPGLHEMSAENAGPSCFSPLLFCQAPGSHIPQSKAKGQRWKNGKELSGTCGFSKVDILAVWQCVCSLGVSASEGCFRGRCLLQNKP